MKKPSFIVIPTLLILPLVSFANVKGITKERQLIGDNGTAYSEVGVVCKGNQQMHMIRKKSAGSRWCSAMINNVCEVNKMKAANQICSKRYERQLHALRNKNQTQKQETHRAKGKTTSPEQPKLISSLVDDKFRLKEEEIKIEQERLKLRWHELQLRKQELQSNDS